MVRQTLENSRNRATLGAGNMIRRRRVEATDSSAAGRGNPAGSGTVDGTQEHLQVEELLANFLAAAVGLKLFAAVPAVRLRAMAPELSEGVVSGAHAQDAEVWYAWRTEAGVARARGQIDVAHSLKVGTTVVFIEWWVPPGTHHAGWWRYDTRRPCDWTKGRGLAGTIRR
jgi:hypothetical protein